MEKFLRNNQELVFWMMGAVLTLVILGFLFFSLRFLIKEIAAGFAINLPNKEEIVKFNLEPLKELKQ